jgi:hypothetical protein
LRSISLEVTLQALFLIEVFLVRIIPETLNLDKTVDALQLMEASIFKSLFESFNQIKEISEYTFLFMSSFFRMTKSAKSCQLMHLFRICPSFEKLIISSIKWQCQSLLQDNKSTAVVRQGFLEMFGQDDCMHYYLRKLFRTSNIRSFHFTAVLSSLSEICLIGDLSGSEDRSFVIADVFGNDDQSKKHGLCISLAYVLSKREWAYLESYNNDNSHTARIDLSDIGSSFPSINLINQLLLEVLPRGEESVIADTLNEQGELLIPILNNLNEIFSKFYSVWSSLAYLINCLFY